MKLLHRCPQRCFNTTGCAVQGGLTPLHMAAGCGQHDAAVTLVQRGASVSAKTKKSLPPLHMATQRDHFDVVDLLLDSGADIDDVSIVREWCA